MDVIETFNILAGAHSAQAVRIKELTAALVKIKDMAEAADEHSDLDLSLILPSEVIAIIEEVLQ